MSTDSTHARTHARKQALQTIAQSIRAEYQRLTVAISNRDDQAIGAALWRLDQSIIRLEVIDDKKQISTYQG